MRDSRWRCLCRCRCTNKASVTRYAACERGTSTVLRSALRSVPGEFRHAQCPNSAVDELTSRGGNQLDTGRSTVATEGFGRSLFRMHIAVDGHRTANCLHNRTSLGTSSRLTSS